MASVKETLITIKTANGTAADMTVKCPLKWCVFDIKTHIMENHPLHPSVRDQKLIFNGALLQDERAVKDVIGNSEAVSIHLVISPTYLRSNSVPARLPQRTADERPHLPPANAPTSATPSNSNNPTQLNTQQQQESTTNPQLQSPGSLRYRIPAAGQPVAPPHPFPAHQMMWSNPYMMSPYYAAQMAQWYGHAFQGAPGPEQANQTPVAADETDGLLLENQPGERGAGGRQEEQDLELPDDMGAAGAGAAGGFALMAENRRRRDAVDYAYMLMMMLFLGAIGYLTGSFYQFVIFFVGVAVILMNQGGWFALQRRAVGGNQPHPQWQPQPEREQDLEREPADVAQPVPGEGDGMGVANNRDRHENEDSQRERQQGNTPEGSEADLQPNVAPQPAQPPRQGAFTTIVVFITSFFSSLLPQQIPEIQAN